MNNVIIDGENNPITFIFAHGAGAGMDHEFMQSVTKGLTFKGIRVIRFNFPYMIKRAQDGKKRPPDRAPKLIDAYSDLIEALNTPCVIGGKSMGGRIASMLANGSDVPAQVQGCIALGYPFHPPGKSDNLRTEHLLALKTPTLIAQGTRDAMGAKEEVSGYGLDKTLELVWLEDGNHDLKPRKASGYTHDAHLQATAKHVADFVKSCL